MSEVDYIAQPSFRTTLDALQSVLQGGEIEQFDVAAAYITAGGAYDLVRRAAHTLGAAWANVPKRWLTSFDYCRTEPVALEWLRSLSNSSIRVYDADFCLKNNGAPKVPFHPKVFLVRTAQRDFALAGSGNMSRSGLSRGVEAGLVIGVGHAPAAGSTAAAAVQAMRTWFSRAWDDAAPLTEPLLAQYDQIFERIENLKAPVPTEDDVASTDTGRNALTTDDLRKLRACRHFWIEAGNITKNRGPNLPGNQLMMKRLSRVFFGFEPKAVPTNTHIGDVEIRIGDGQGARFSLTYSDNKMDKLVLPMPGVEGVPGYDNQYLLFRRTKPGVFELTVEAKAKAIQWAKKSAAVDAAFRMSRGRVWGVF